MDLSVDPCSDFYQFSCGKWNTKYPTPGSAQHWTNFVRLDRKNLEIIRRALEGRGKNKFKSKLMKKVHSFYEVCKERDDETLQDVRNFLQKLVKSLNLKLNEKNPKKDLAEISARLMQEFGVIVLFRLSVGINDKNSSAHVLKLDQPQLTLPNKEDYATTNNTRKEKNRKTELDYMIKVNKLISGKQILNDKDIKILKDIIDLEYELSAAEMNPGEHRAATHEANEVTIEQLDNNFKFLDWKHFIKNTINSKDGKTVGHKEKIIMTSPAYFHNVTNIISDKLKTKEGKILLEKFLVWKVFDSLVPILSLPFRQARQDLVSSLADASHRYWPFVYLSDLYSCPASFV